MTKQDLESRVEDLEEYLESVREELAEAISRNDELRWAFKILAG